MTVASVLVCAATATAAGGQSLPRVEPVTRIGCAVCDGPEAFADIARLAVGPDGRIRVVDSSEPFIRVFEASGEHVRSFGRRGDGPGEFRSPTALHVNSDGSFTVIDIRTRRLSRHAPDGSESSVHPLRRFPIATAATATGDLWIAATDFIAPTLVIERWPADGDSAVTVRTLEPDFPKRDETTPSSLVALAARPDGGFAIADGESFYHIRIYDASGRAVADITRDMRRLRRTPAEVAEEEARRDRNAARIAAMRRAEGGSPGRLPAIPELKRHFLTDALQYDARGRLWVRTERGSADESVFDVFRPDHTWLGEIRVPGRMRRFAIGEDLLIGIVYDAAEAQYVQVYRIAG